MRSFVRIPVIATFCILTGSFGYAQYQQPTQPSDTANPKSDADNTRVNKRDRNKTEATADQANQNKSDRDIMQEIRKSITDDKSLSTNAHNVKIISRGGKVTLKGPVNSEEEKTQIESKAKEVAGAGNVTNNLTVKASKSANKY